MFCPPSGAEKSYQLIDYFSCLFILTFCFIIIQANWSFKSFLRSLANFVSSIVNLVLLELALSLSAPAAADKTQSLVDPSLNSTLHLVNGISNDLQKLINFCDKLIKCCTILECYLSNIFFYNSDITYDITKIYASLQLQRWDFSTSGLYMISFPSLWFAFDWSLIKLYFLVTNLESLASFNKFNIFDVSLFMLFH